MSQSICLKISTSYIFRLPKRMLWWYVPWTKCPKDDVYPVMTNTVPWFTRLFDDVSLERRNPDWYALTLVRIELHTWSTKPVWIRSGGPRTPNIKHTDSSQYVSETYASTLTVLPNLSLHNVSLYQRVGTHRSGMPHLRDALSKGTHWPRGASSNWNSIQGTHWLRKKKKDIMLLFF